MQFFQVSCRFPLESRIYISRSRWTRIGQQRPFCERVLDPGSNRCRGRFTPLHGSLPFSAFAPRTTADEHRRPNTPRSRKILASLCDLRMHSKEAGTKGRMPINATVNTPGALVRMCISRNLWPIVVDVGRISKCGDSDAPAIIVCRLDTNA